MTSRSSGDPVAALRRIAFLLERRLADSYRIKAYRGAAATLLTLSAEEVARRAEAGTLRDLPGIGAKTATVVGECLAGGEPAYLTELEATAGPLVEGGEEHRAALRGDLHSHSDWSDGGSPIEEMAMTAMELGHAYLVLTDHSPRLTVAHGLTVARLRRQLEVVDAVNEHLAGGGFRLLRGIEVDILDDGSLDQTDAMLGELDLVVASVHSKLKMESAAMTRRMVAAVSHPRTAVLGHCTGRLVKGGRGTRAQSSFDAEAVFGACAEHDVAVEINSRPERCDPPDELVGLALDLGCVFSIDSDAHAPGQLDFLQYGAERAQRLGVPIERIVNSWPVDRLLDWAGDGPGNLRHMAPSRSPSVEVRRSRKRRRTVAAYREDDKVVVLLPARFTRAEEEEWVAAMLARLERSERRRRPSDAALAKRAAGLSAKHLDGRADPLVVRWVENQNSRWGSCTPSDRSIRLSTRLQGMPSWVIDYVLVHELAHLLESGHTPEFWAWVDRYPRAERAKGFLEGVAAASQLGIEADPPDCSDEGAAQMAADDV